MLILCLKLPMLIELQFFFNVHFEFLPSFLPPSSLFLSPPRFSNTFFWKKNPTPNSCWMTRGPTTHEQKLYIQSGFFLWILEKCPHVFSANILMESASLGFLVTTLCLEVVVLFTVLCLVHPAVITLPTNPGRLLP